MADKVDVLAVMDGAFGALNSSVRDSHGAGQLREARAAVVELLSAANTSALVLENYRDAADFSERLDGCLRLLLRATERFGESA